MRKWQFYASVSTSLFNKCRCRLYALSDHHCNVVPDLHYFIGMFITPAVDLIVHLDIWVSLFSLFCLLFTKKPHIYHSNLNTDYNYVLYYGLLIKSFYNYTTSELLSKGGLIFFYIFSNQFSESPDRTLRRP